MTNFKEQASNRVVARLLASLVNEKFFKGHLLSDSDSLPHQLQDFSKPGKFWLIASSSNDERQHTQEEGTFWFPLQGLPLLQENSAALLDLEDIAFPVLQKTSESGNSGSFSPVDVRIVMDQLKKWHPELDLKTIQQLTLELEDCVEHQEAAYHHHDQRSLPSLKNSEAIEWEQIIVEGHPVHPMYKARFAVPPALPVDPWNNQLQNPTLHFFAVPRSQVTVREDYDKLLAPLVKLQDSSTSPVIDQLGVDMKVDVIIPVHQYQVPNVLHYFPKARQLPFTREARAQASVRSVVVKELPDLNVKLALGLKIGSAMRTITPCTAHNGPAFKAIADILFEDKLLLEPAHEIASVFSNNSDESVAKHLSCVLREDPQSLASPRGEKVVVCSALKERCSSTSTEYVINAVLNLDTPGKKELFFRRYASLFLRAFVPPLFKHGVCFEAHLQNVLARFKPVAATGEENDPSWELVGFTIRDFGGIKVHQESLRSSTGLELKVLDAKESTKLAHDLDEVHHLAYHVMIQGHLLPIARALDVHYNRRGWDFIREELDQILPPDCHTRSLWLDSETSVWKAFMRMKFDDLYRDYLYTPVPNLIVYGSH